MDCNNERGSHLIRQTVYGQHDRRSCWQDVNSIGRLHVPSVQGTMAVSMVSRLDAPACQQHDQWILEHSECVEGLRDRFSCLSLARIVQHPPIHRSVESKSADSGKTLRLSAAATVAGRLSASLGNLIFVDSR